MCVYIVKNAIGRHIVNIYMFVYVNALYICILENMGMYICTY